MLNQDGKKFLPTHGISISNTSPPRYHVGVLSLPTDFRVNHSIFGQINSFDGKRNKYFLNKNNTRLYLKHDHKCFILLFFKHGKCIEFESLWNIALLLLICLNISAYFNCQ